MIAQYALTPVAQELLVALSQTTGFDIYCFSQANAGRELERQGLARIVRAKAPPPGWQQQPYFGIKIKAAGRKLLKSAEARQ